MALDEGNALLWVNAAGKHQRIGGQGVVFQLLRVLTDGDGVLVDNAVCAIIFVLKQSPVFNSAQVVAQGESAAGRLDAGEDDLFAFRFVFGDVHIVFHNSSFFLLSFISFIWMDVQDKGGSRV